MVLVVDHGIAVHILISGIELIAVDSKLHFGPFSWGKVRNSPNIELMADQPQGCCRRKAALMVQVVIRKLFNDFTEAMHYSRA